VVRTRNNAFDVESTIVKIAFVGKGGSGKTTLTALLARHIAALGRPQLVLDADINQHLAVALGATPEEASALPTLGQHLPLIKDYLRGNNPRIASAAHMTKTTPPGRGSRLLRVGEANPIAAACVRTIAASRSRSPAPSHRTISVSRAITRKLAPLSCCSIMWSIWSGNMSSST